MRIAVLRIRMTKMLIASGITLAAAVTGAQAQTDLRPKLESFAITGLIDTQEAYCAEFTLTRPQVEQFLSSMKSAPTRYYTDDLFSPCKIEGTFRYTNGDAGSFVIASSGMGLIETANKGLRTVFAQPNWTDPSAGTYFNAD